MQDLTSESFILTGGQHSGRVVARYDMQGHVEDLPQLAVARYGHGCGSYLRGDGTQVSVVYSYSCALGVVCSWCSVIMVKCVYGVVCS